MDVRFHGNDKSKKTDKRFASFKRIICVSETAKHGFISKFGFGGKLEVAYTPVDADEIISKSNEKSDVSCPFDGGFYISVGRLEDVKGFDRLIEAVALSSSATAHAERRLRNVSNASAPENAFFLREIPKTRILL